MSFLSEGKRTIKADERYENIYTKLTERTGMNIPEIFYLCVLLGFKNQRQSTEFTAGRKELRVSYFDENQRAILYTIANEHHSLTEFSDAEKVSQIIRGFQKYSNGGMEILIEEVFKDRYREGSLQDSYPKYDVDILKFLYDQITEIPF